MSMSTLGLISELVTIDHGKYIVKVSVQNNNLILGTALAGADTVEKAEDEARKRAIAVLDLVKNIDTTQFSKSPTRSPQNISSSSTPVPERVSPTTPSSIKSQKEVQTNPLASPVITTEKTLSNNRPITTPQNEHKSVSQLNVQHQPSIINQPDTNKLESSSIRDREINSPKNEENLREVSKIEPIENINSSVDNPPEEPTSDTPLLNNLTANEKQENTVSPQPTETSATMDFSQIINQTTIELKRLGWTQEDGKKYLLATYGKKSRHLLSDEELIEFLNYLQTLDAKS